MAEPNAHIIYTSNDIDRYLNGGMTAKEMHDIERAALQDPFLADAIEGYRESDTQQSERHLNEIAAAIQGERGETKIISLPKKKNYSWQIAAAVIVVIGIGFLLFNQTSSHKSETILASNESKGNENKNKEKKNSSSDERAKEISPQRDSSLLALKSNAEATVKPKRAEANKEISSFKKTESSRQVAVPPSPSKDEQASLIASAPAASGYFDTDKNVGARQQQAAPVMTDTAAINSSLAEVVVTGYGTARKARMSADIWTTDKNKPFRLSDVEVITIGKKNSKPTDTTAVKPEGGWRLFSEYLFSRLSKKDTLTFMNSSRINGNLELEFSFNEAGSPYNIQVVQAHDSTTVHEVISAVQNGPKWTSSDKKEKRLRIKY